MSTSGRSTHILRMLKIDISCNENFNISQNTTSEIPKETECITTTTTDESMNLFSNDATLYCHPNQMVNFVGASTSGNPINEENPNHKLSTEVLKNVSNISPLLGTENSKGNNSNLFIYSAKTILFLENVTLSSKHDRAMVSDEDSAIVHNAEISTAGNKLTCIENLSSSLSSSSSSSSEINENDSNAANRIEDYSDEDSQNDPYGSDDSVRDPLYQETRESSDSEAEIEVDQDENPSMRKKMSAETQTEKIGKKKRKIRPELWQKNQSKNLRNKGESYISTQIQKNENGTLLRVKKERPRRFILPPCGQKCRLKCCDKISAEQRELIFSEFYRLGDLGKQREYIASNITQINPKYKYSNVANPRKPNNAFTFIISGQNIRVCKTYFMATLAINNRTIQTVLKKQSVCESGKVLM
ncbi:uncharacterized protein [Diabrotica undecimpunctata]|uniref:uncharacterized protein n=1 Tax=Diabrotica undecimpunctata TaxID=50387 RepID=UPI003B638A51